jgi:lycopene beta-cyclase
MQLLQCDGLKDKNILLIEQDTKTLNDRTWCFWEKEEGFFEQIVYRKWDKAWFHAPNYSSLKQLSPYQYKMIRGIDFYTYCYDVIRNSGRVDVVHQKVISLENISGGVLVKTNEDIYQGGFVFNSILFEKPQVKEGQFYMLQHFKGWVIETFTPAFKQHEATLMDFRVNQQEGTTFVYVMPLSEKHALVEFTLFTPSLLEDSQYDAALKDYIASKLGIADYTVTESEFGVIPMTNHDFPINDGRIVYLGTAGGQTKPSSGYTFKFIQKHAAALVKQLEKEGNPFVKTSLLKKRFLWYDRVLLHLLSHRKMEGSRIFYLLFKRNKISRLFAFLDNESSINQELILMNTLPQWPFMKAGLKELFK